MRPAWTLVELVGLFADVPDVQDVHRAPVQDAGGVASVWLAVWSVELVFGLETVLLQHLSVALDDDEVGLHWPVTVGGDPAVTQICPGR